MVKKKRPGRILDEIWAKKMQPYILQKHPSEHFKQGPKFLGVIIFEGEHPHNSKPCFAQLFQGRGWETRLH